MGRELAVLALLGLLTLGYAARCPRQRNSPGREILCYTSTNDPATLEDSICKCTTLVHQGHDLKQLSTSGIAELQKSLKDVHPVLQFVLAINDNDGTLKTSAQVRLEATARVVRILNEVDGIELNVTAGSKERLVHFVQGLRTEMARKSKDKRILMVLPTKPQDLAKQFDLKALSKYVDLFTIPTHYLVEDDEAFRTFHPSRLIGLFDMLNTDSIVDLITGLGAEKRKILVSIPASVYKFELENSRDNAPRAPSKTKQPYEISRSEMCVAMEKGEWIVERDEDLTAPYAFKDNTWIAFEDKISVGIKGKYVLLRDLAGLGIHNVEKDSESKCGKSLTEEVYRAFTDNKRKTREAVLTSLHDDLQQTPDSYPSHVKSSEFRIVRVVDTDGHVHASRENMQTEFSCPRQGYFVHPKSCNRFYRCVKFNQEVEDYSVFEFDCPAGLAFDERTEVCVWPGSITEGSACPGSSEIAPSKGPKFTCPEKAGYYADLQNCRFFYACYDLGEGELTAYEFRCPYGLVFDEEKLICEWPYLVPSCGGSTYNRKEYEGGHGSYGSGYGGYDDHIGDAENSKGHTEVHSGYDGSNGQVDLSGGGYHGSSYDGQGGSSNGGYDSSHAIYPVTSEGPTTVNIGYSGHGHGDGYGNTHGGGNSDGYEDGHGGSQAGGHAEGHSNAHGDGPTTIPSGHGTHDINSGTSYDNGYATGQSGYGGIGHSTVHPGQGGSGHPTVHGGSDGSGYTTDFSGHNENGHTTVHPGHGGNSHTTIHTSYSGSGHTTVHPVYGDNGHTTLGSGYGHDNAHGGLSTIHPGYSDNRYTTLGSGYRHDNVHDGLSTVQPERGEHGNTLEHSENGNSQGASSKGHGDQHIADHSGYDGHTTIQSGSTDGHVHSEAAGGYTDGHTTQSIHGEDVHSSHVGFFGNGHTTVHAGLEDSAVHSGVDDGGYNVGYSVQTANGEDRTISHTGHEGSSGTSVDSALGDVNTHSETSEVGLGDGHVAIHSGYDEPRSSQGHTTQSEYEGNGHAIVHSELGGHGVQGESTIYSAFGNGNSHIGTSAVGTTDGHVNVQSGHGGSGHLSLGDGGSNVGPSGSGYVIGHDTIHAGLGDVSTHGNSRVTGPSTYNKNEPSTVHLEFGNVYGGPTEGEYSNMHATQSGDDSGHMDGVTHVVSPHASYTGSSGVSHPTGYSEQYKTTEELTGKKGNFGHGYQTGSGKFESTTLDKGAFTRITSGVYNSGFPIHVTHYSENTASTVAPGIAYSAGVGISKNTASTIHYGNSGLDETREYSNTNGATAVPTRFNTGSYDHHTSIIASHGVPSSESTFYSKNAASPRDYVSGVSTGRITGGLATQGVTGTSHSTSGNIYGYGDVSGNIQTGTSKQGVVVTDIAQPGYVHAHSETPGYVITNGIRTTYDAESSRRGFSQGVGGDGVSTTAQEAPGIILTGQSRPEVYLEGSTFPGVVVSGTNKPGTFISVSSGGQYNPARTDLSTYSGSQYDLKTSTVPKNPFLFNNGNRGYKTNEYHDNGGRGTIRYNNGEITHKYTEDDVRDHQTKFGTLPKFDVGSYETSSTDFTKTGPTKTGITTAQLGGSGTYVSGTTRSKPVITSSSIGAKAFSGNPGLASGSRKTSNDDTYRTSTSSPDITYTTTGPEYTSGEVDASNINLGSTKFNTESQSGYNYAKPKIQFNTFGITGMTRAPPTPLKHDILTHSASPGPYLNVHVYNNPSTVTSSPIGFSTGPVENIKTIDFITVKNPSAVSNVQSITNTGYKTAISSTGYPIGGHTNSFDYTRNTGYRTNSLLTKGDSAIDINVPFQSHLTTEDYDESIAPAVGVESWKHGQTARPIVSQSVITYPVPTISNQPVRGLTDSSGYSETKDYSNYTYKQTDGTFGQRIHHDSVTSAPIHQTPIVTPSSEIYNIRTSTITPAIVVTYKPSLKIDVSQQTSRVPTEGYSYSRPSVKYSSAHSASVTDKYGSIDGGQSSSGYNDETPSNVGVSKTEVVKLITNYNRGSTKFIPSRYETFDGDNREETTLSTIGCTHQETHLKNTEQPYLSGGISSADKTGGYGRLRPTTPSYTLKTVSQGFGNRLETSSARDYTIFGGNSDSSSNLGVVESTTFLPISKSSPATLKSFSRRPSSRGPTTPVITTYSGGYNRGPSTLSYAATTPKSADTKKGRGKVIVKFSDLHPLLLGKLGAECTCKADPFAIFRDGKPLPIESSKGRIDLNNYDESEVYVDLESSKENGDYDASEYITKSEYDDRNKYETPVIAVFGGVTAKPKFAAIKSQQSPTTCRPISSSSYLPPESSTSRPSLSKYSSTLSGDNFGASFPKNDVSVSASFANKNSVGRFRVGKNLDTSKSSSPNLLTPESSNFDRYGPGGLRGLDETLQGANNCARPGLFRHPNYCNKFYVCHWDEWKKKFTLHVFNCPVHLTFDSGASACNWPSKGPACQDDNLLV